MEKKKALEWWSAATIEAAKSGDGNNLTVRNSGLSQLGADPWPCSLDSAFVCNWTVTAPRRAQWKPLSPARITQNYRKKKAQATLGYPALMWWWWWWW
jgi:hypothetical protein